MFGRRGFNRRRAKIIDGYGLSPPASTGISPGESIRGYQMREIRLRGFQKPPVPNPRRRVLRVWQTRFQPPTRKKSARERDCRPPPGISPCESIRGYQTHEIRLRGFQKRTHPQPAMAGWDACFRGVVSTAGAQEVIDGYGLSPPASTGISPCESIRGYEKRETREGGFCVFGRLGFNRRRAKNHRWIGIVAPRQAYPLRRINSRL